VAHRQSGSGQIMRIAITGGGGFVGRHLTAQLRALGHRVTVLARGVTPGEADFIPFALESAPQPDRLTGFDALIHAAWDFNAADDRNVTGSASLFKAARAAGVPRLLFISTLSAFEGCQSNYGATKLATERQLTPIGVSSVRLGIVCDNSGGGLSGSLEKMAMLPVIPLPGGGKQNLHTVSADDLGPAFRKILEHCERDPVSLANPAPVSLKSMMRIFARRKGKNAIFLPFPWRLIWAPLRAAEAAGIKLRFRSDSLVSLMYQNPAPDFTVLQKLDIRLRSFVDEG
jgi:nucleoside-diphosphate-sugar epimerase